MIIDRQPEGSFIAEESFELGGALYLVTMWPEPGTSEYFMGHMLMEAVRESKRRIRKENKAKERENGNSI